MKFDIDLEGFAELEKQLASLDIVTQKRILRRAVRESAAPMLSQMRSAVTSQGHVDTGLLQDSVKLKTSIPKGGKWADAIAEVGVYKNVSGQKAAGRKIDPPVYAYWLEFGTEPHALGKSAKRERGKRQDTGLYHPGITAKPFIRPTFDGNVETALGIQKTVLSKAIDRALNVSRR